MQRVFLLRSNFFITANPFNKNVDNLANKVSKQKHSAAFENCENNHVSKSESLTK